MSAEDLVARITAAVIRQIEAGRQDANSSSGEIPAGVSNRHVHLSQRDLVQLFGADVKLTKMKELSQPGQFACEEKVRLAGPSGVIEGVRVLGPVRDRTQVEISAADGFKLGVKAPLRESGDLGGSAPVVLIGPAGIVSLPEGMIVAARHLHMPPEAAARFGVRDKSRVYVRAGGERGMIFAEVVVRVSPSYRLEFHVDLDEANAAGLRNGDRVSLYELPGKSLP